jgi:hypothetical protein
MNTPEVQKIDLSDVLASMADLGLTNKPQKLEPSFDERMKTVAWIENYLLENDSSYLRAYKKYPLRLERTKKWIAEQLR